MTREESQRHTREMLLRASMQLVSQRGYDASSIGAIVEAAGFTKGAFFSNFESKDALLLELTRRHHETELAELQAIMEGDEAAVQSSIAAYVDGMVANRDWLMLSIELALRASRDPVFATRYLPVRRAFSAALGTLVASLLARDGATLPIPVAEVGGLVLSVVLGLSLTAAAGVDRPPPSEQLALVIHGLKLAGQCRPQT